MEKSRTPVEIDLAAATAGRTGRPTPVIPGNLAIRDRCLRVVLGAALLWLAWISVGALLSAALGTVGVALLLTGLVGSCPLYAVLGLDTPEPRPR